MDTQNTFAVPEQPDSLPPEPTAHPLYQDVEFLINQGNWHAAQAPIAELLALYPDDPYLQELATAIRTRSALLGSLPEAIPAPAHAPLVTRGLKLIIPGVVLLTLLCVAAGIFLAMSWWIWPQATAQRQEARISQLQQEAQVALSSGDYDRAVLAYNELLELMPSDRQALEGLKQANQLRAIISLYSEAIAEMEAYHWENALALLQQIEAEQPGYRDVTQRISFIQQQQDLSNRFSEAEATFNQGNYELAIENYEALQSTDYGFQSETVQNRLFLSYLQLGLAEEEAAGDNPQRLQTALDKFEKALALRPEDSQAKGESKLLSSYLAGLAELKAKNWSEAISYLTPVYEARPDFANSTVGQALYDAYVGWGDELFAAEQFEQALTKYEEAHSLRGVDISDLNEKIALVGQALVTPTPEPTSAAPVVATGGGNAPAPAPVPTATPVPQPYALTGMSVRSNCSGSGYIHGVVWNAYNLPLAGVVVQAINTTTGFGPIISNPTNADGIYQIIVNGDQIEGLWMVQILENGQPASLGWGQRLGGGCINGAQELKADWQRALQLQ